MGRSSVRHHHRHGGSINTKGDFYSHTNGINNSSGITTTMTLENNNHHTHSHTNTPTHTSLPAVAISKTTTSGRGAGFITYSVILCVLVFVCYCNALSCGFVFDDMTAINSNKDLRPTTPILNLFNNDFWGTPMIKERSHKSYRPLCVLTFRWNYLLGELNPIGYHLVNVCLHAIVSILYMDMVSKFLGLNTSFMSALLFAVHPIHTETVTGVVGRAEMLSSIFYLAAFHCYYKATKSRNLDWLNLLSTVLLVTIAMLCKEQGITAVAVCCVFDVFVAQQKCMKDVFLLLKGPHFPLWFRQSLCRISILVLGTVALLVTRISAVQGAELPVFTRFDNPASQEPTPIRQLTYNYLLSINSWLLLHPSQLCCDWTMGTVPLVETLTDIRNLATVVFWTVLTCLTYLSLFKTSTMAKAVGMALAFLIFPFIPASNLFFPVGFVVAERTLYVPSMGFCMLIAIGLKSITDMSVKFRQSFDIFTKFVMLYLMFFGGLKTFMRNYDWECEYTLFRSALTVNTKNAKLWNNVGHALENEGQFNVALGYFKMAAFVQPDDIGAHINVGRTFKNLEMYQEAEECYIHAKQLMPSVIPGKKYTTRINPNYLNVYINLANLIKMNSSRLLEADNLYKQAVSMRPDFVQAYINRGDILLRLNNTDEALNVYKTALQYENDNADIYFNLGIVYLERGDKQRALGSFNSALDLEPFHSKALYNSAVILQESADHNHKKQAQHRLQTLMDVDPDNERLYFSLGMMAMDEDNTSEAEMFFKKAVELEPTFRSALFNLALLYSESNRALLAEPYLNTIIELYPNHVKSLILLGDITLNKHKDISTAKQYFSRAIESEPNNELARHNLCIAHVESGHLYHAERCLLDLIKRAPNRLQAQEHLQLIRNRIAAATAVDKNNHSSHDQSQQSAQTTDSQSQQPPRTSD